MRMLGDINRTLYHAARYLLGTIMLYYAIVKLVNVQFQVSPFTYTRPLDQVPGRMLAWAYLGYAPWFQRLLGVAEFTPALMLFLRRTARLAASVRCRACAAFCASDINGGMRPFGGSITNDPMRLTFFTRSSQCGGGATPPQ